MTTTWTLSSCSRGKEGVGLAYYLSTRDCNRRPGLEIFALNSSAGLIVRKVGREFVVLGHISAHPPYFTPNSCCTQTPLFFPVVVLD